jgi:cyclophilin family peptidyl-prolyl cis-trans isomerase
MQSAVMDVLESRVLFSGETVASPIPAVLANLTTPTNNSITLDQFFTDADIPGTLATFDTTFGTIKVGLTDAATPATVANFLYYINSGEYTNTIIHRSALIVGSGTVGPANPADIIQGGGYVVSGTSINHIPTVAPVKDEYTTEIYNDSAGTLAMAKTSDANSATSEWYFNVHDTSSGLDTPTTDSNGVTTSYTVFGKVISGMDVIDKIAALPTYQISSSLTNVPVIGLTPGQVTKHRPVTASNLVYIKSITAKPGTSYTVTSSDYGLVRPSISNGVLSFAYASGKFGTATITVNAVNVDGTSASDSFTVTVPNSATPTAGPTAANITAPNITEGTTGTFSVLSGTTDSAAAINQSTVAITTQPAHGTASVNSSTGLISYTPTAGYTGADTLSYTVADTAGSVSSPATVTLNVVAPPATVTIGNSTARSLTFTGADGHTGHLYISNGAAVITFASSSVTISKAGGVATATGSGASIASIVITSRGSGASLRLVSDAAIGIGSISDTGRVTLLDLPNATLTGNYSFGSIGRLTAAAVVGSTLSLGSGASSLIIPSVTNTNVTSTRSIASISSTQWLNTDGGYYGILTPRLGQLKVTGTFAESLNLTATTKTDLTRAITGQASEAWVVAGAVGSVTTTTPASTWSLGSGGSIGSITINGNLTNSIQGVSLGSLSVTGTTTGASIITSGAFSLGTQGMGRLKFGGAVTQSTITDTGALGSITAPSMDTNTITAGTLGTLNVKGDGNAVTINTTTTSVFNKPTIGHVTFGGGLGNSTFSTSGNVGPISATAMTSDSITGLTFASLRVTGATSSTTIKSTSAAARDGVLRFGGAVTGSTISAAASIASLSAASFSSSSATFSSIGTLSIAGTTTSGTITSNSSAVTDGSFHFGGAVTGTNISASGTVKRIFAGSMATVNLTTAAIGSLVVAGTTASSTLTTASSTERIGSVRFDGAVVSTKLAAAGSVGSVFAASLSGSQIYAGVTATVAAAPGLPASTSDFASDQRIGSVTLGAGASAFSNSLISAEKLGSLHLGNVNTASSNTAFGVAAHTIRSVAAHLSTGGTLAAGPAQLKSATTLSAYETAKKLSLGEFVVTLV